MTDTARVLTRTAATLAMIAVTTAACGDGGSEVTADSQTDTTTAATTPATTPATTAPAST